MGGGEGETERRVGSIRYAVYLYSVLVHVV